MSKEIFDIGDDVFCDYCGKDYSNSDAQGGIMFGSKGACPECAERVEEGARKHNEMDWIKARCPEGKSFKDWILQDIREGNNQIVTYSGDDADAFLAQMTGQTTI